MSTVLLVEDNHTLSAYYEKVLQASGHIVQCAANAAQGLRAFTQQQPQVVALDLVLPDRDGLDMMRDCLTQAPGCRFVVITAHGSIPAAVESMRQGAFEFLPKPFSDDEFLSAIERAIAARSKGNDVVLPKAGPAKASDPASIPCLPGLIGTSPPIQEMSRQVRSVADSPAPITIMGEEGSGKLACAKAIHALSARAKGPLKVLRPTGAATQHQAQLVTEFYCDARAGTLVLDTPSAIAAPAQERLLGLIRDDIGHANAPRLIALCDGDPIAEARAGALNNALLHQLFVVPLHTPPLRERGEDVITLANAALREFDTRTNDRLTGLAPDVADVFRTYDWPGNVRQLLNVIRSMILLHKGPLVTLKMLPTQIVEGDHDAEQGAAMLAGLPLAQAERVFIERAIRDQGGSIPRAAAVLGVSPSTIYRKREVWSRDDET